MWLLLVVVGTVGLCIPSQFHGQGTLSLVLLGLGVALLIVQGLVFRKAARTIKRAGQDVRYSRGRRGF